MTPTNRRDFLKISAAAGLSAMPVEAAFAEPAERLLPGHGKRRRAVPRFGLWCGCDPQASPAELKAKYKQLRSRGIGCVLISGVDDREFEIIREAGIEVHCWMWTTNRADAWIRKNHSDWDKWPLNAACPMLCHSFFDEPVEWIGVRVLVNVRAVDFPVIAGLYVPAFQSPDEFAKDLASVRRRGSHGVSLFGAIGEPMWRAFEKAVESWS